MGINQQLFGYIDACPTAFHTVAHTADMLEDAGYTRLSETESWKLRPGEGYFVTRNGSSLIAFRVPEEEFPCFMIAAAHGDAPTFKIKENAGHHGQELCPAVHGEVRWDAVCDMAGSPAGNCRTCRRAHTQRTGDADGRSGT